MYMIDITGTFPRCTCIDWLENELPCKHIFHVMNTTALSWEELPEVFRFVFWEQDIPVMDCDLCSLNVAAFRSVFGILLPSNLFRTHPMFTIDEEALRCQDPTYDAVGDTKDLEPDVLHSLLNFIDSNAQDSSGIPQVDLDPDTK